MIYCRIVSMKTTREKVLYIIKTNPKSTVMQIAEFVGIDTISIRHHLTKLQAEGLIHSEEERHGVGRPRLVYSLTQVGQETFPTRYFSLSNNLLHEIKNTLSKDKVNQLFQNMAENISRDYLPSTHNITFRERLNLLIEFMEKQGFDLIWDKDNDTYSIKEICCPYHQLGEIHPEICIFDRTIIANFLGIPAEAIEHSKNMHNICTYTFRSPNNDNAIK